MGGRREWAGAQRAGWLIRIYALRIVLQSTSIHDF
jgi:hypothetical protein